MSHATRKKLAYIRFSICLGCALFFGISSLHAFETVKEAQIDQHLSYVDGALKQMNDDRKEARNKRDAQVEQLTRANEDALKANDVLDARIGRDEAIASTAFTLVSALSTLGLLSFRKTTK